MTQKLYRISQTIRLSKDVVAESKQEAMEYWSETDARTELLSFKAVILENPVTEKSWIEYNNKISNFKFTYVDN